MLLQKNNHMAFSKEKIISYSCLILLGVYFTYAFYETFFLKDPSPFSVISTALFFTIVGGIIGMLILEKISLTFRKNKVLKKITEKFEKTWNKVMDSFFGFY